MTKIMTSAGHLTDEALSAVIEGRLTQDERLEVSEHLAVCDHCLLRYTNLLTDDLLLPPPAPQTPSIIARVRSRARRLFINQYSLVALAASLALFFFLSGVFTPAHPLSFESTLGQIDTATSAITQRANAATKNVSQWFNSLVKFDWKGVPNS